MSTFTVEVQRTITTEVDVEAHEESDAIDLVRRGDVVLPSQDRWETLRGQTYIIHDENGSPILEDAGG